MLPSVTFSSRGRAGTAPPAPIGRLSGARRRRASAAALAAAAALRLATPAAAKVFLSQDEALRLAFPDGARVERRTAYLSEDQAGAVERAAGEPMPYRVVTYYAGSRGEAPAGTAYFDTHVVRTLPETVMVVVTPQGTIGRVDILSFAEPLDYLPRARWIQQLSGRRLDEDLSQRRGIRPISGATLSGRAIVATARRILALHAILSAAGPPGATAPGELRRETP